MALDTWVMQPGWNFLDEYGDEEYLDKMGAIGVGNLAFGAALPLESNPANYHGSIKGSPPFDFQGQETRILGFLEAAWRRDFGVYAYGTNPHMALSEEVSRNFRTRRRLNADGEVEEQEFTWGTCANDEEYLQFYLGRLRDAHQAFPRLAGFLNDGPEFGYEISPELFGGMLTIFSCFGACCERKAADLGYDLSRLRAAAAELMRSLRTLDDGLIERTLRRQGDPADMLAAVAGDPAIVDWFLFKRASIADYIRRLCTGVKEIHPDLEMGIGSRLPTTCSILQGMPIFSCPSSICGWAGSTDSTGPSTGGWRPWRGGTPDCQKSGCWPASSASSVSACRRWSRWTTFAGISDPSSPTPWSSLTSGTRSRPRFSPRSSPNR